MYWVRKNSITFVILALFSIVSGTLFPYSSIWAATSSPTPSSSITLEDFDKICKDALNPSNRSTTPTEKIQYCQAAQSSQEASEANGNIWKVWAAVGGVCALACLASFAGIVNQYVCALSSAAGGAADAVITKNFASALMAIGGAGMSIMVNNTFTTHTEKKVDGKIEVKETKRDIGACLLAAMAGFQSYSNYNSMKTNETSAQANLASAAAVTSNNANLASAGMTSTAANNIPSGNTSIASSGAAQIQPITSSSPDPVGKTSCGSNSTRNNAGMILQCAVSSDSNLPKYVTTPKFSNDFRKASGLDLGEFLNKSDNPKNALLSSMGGTLNPNQATQLASAVNDLEQQMKINPNNSAYSGGGGSRSSGGGDPQLGDILSGVMGQFLPKTADGQNSNNNTSTIAFNPQRRLAIANPEDRSLSIFDRISYRYYYLSPRILGEGRGEK